MKTESIIGSYISSHEIHAVLSESLQGLREGKISATTSNVISRQTGKIMSNAKLELEAKFGALKRTKAKSKKLAEFEKLAKAKGTTVLKLIYDEHRKLVKELEQLRTGSQSIPVMQSRMVAVQVTKVKQEPRTVNVEVTEEERKPLIVHAQVTRPKRKFQTVVVRLEK